jgi:hypothetical protein
MREKPAKSAKMNINDRLAKATSFQQKICYCFSFILFYCTGKMRIAVALLLV